MAQFTDSDGHTLKMVARAGYIDVTAYDSDGDYILSFVVLEDLTTAIADAAPTARVFVPDRGADGWGVVASCASQEGFALTVCMGMDDSAITVHMSRDEAAAMLDRSLSEALATVASQHPMMLDDRGVREVCAVAGIQFRDSRDYSNMFDVARRVFDNYIAQLPDED